MNFEEYIEQIVSADRIYVEDSECIDESNDYEGIIKELFILSGNELKLDAFEVKEKEVIKLFITVNNKDYSFIIGDSTCWLENINLVKGLNEILSKNESEYRYYSFWAADCFGQEIGFFYAKKEIAEQIINYAKNHNSTVTEYIEQYQITDGTIEEGFEEEF